jgi:cAMP-dependent protein kinase regulator
MDMRMPESPLASSGPDGSSERAGELRRRVAKRTNAVPEEREHFETGTVLVRQGELGDRAWLVIGGTLEATLAREGRSERIGLIGPGGIVGEMSLIDAGKRTATVRALSRVTAIPISRAAFDEALETSPLVVRYLLETLIATLRRSYGLPSWERLEGSTEFRSAKHASEVLHRRVVTAGHVFFREGESPSSVCLIQSGRVRIDTAKDGPVAELGPGRIFGELAILSGKPRAATATAIEQTACEFISGRDLQSALDRTPKILRTLAYAYVRRIEKIGEFGGK